MLTLHWKKISRAGEALLLVRKQLSGPAQTMHDHDFVEAFYVEAGSGTHHLNGKQHPLNEGDFVFIRSKDFHNLQGKGPKGLTIVNAAFSPEISKRVRGLLPQAWEAAFPPPSQSARHWSLPPDTRALLKRHWQRLESTARDRTTASWLLTEFVVLLDHFGSISSADLAPAWLTDALGGLSSPATLREGVPGLVRRASRAPAYLSRAVRNYYQCTPTELVNKARLDYAAQQLEMGEDSITDISLDCGFESVSHFIRLFKGRFGEPPLRYRRRRLGLLQAGSVD